jgi:hypothetical protein
MAELAAASPHALLSERYRRAFDVAVVVVVAGWQVGGAGTQLLADRTEYRSDALQLAAWMAFDLLITAGSVLLLRKDRNGLSFRRRRGTSRRDQRIPARSWAWSLAAAAAVTAGVVAATCPPNAMLKTDWAWGTAGWVAVLVLLRRPFAELCGFIALNALTVLAIQVRDGMHRSDAAAFLTVLAGSAGVQLAVAVAARALDLVARRAANAAQAQAAALEKAAIGRLLEAERQTRWRMLEERAGPLISALAAGSADPGDAEIRRQCAVESARLRRLMAESDDAAGPLLHELQASASIAERRGVVLDIETAGSIPDVPAAVRRVFTDMAIEGLTTARTRARITVMAADDAVAVSLVTDAPTVPELPSLTAMTTDSGPVVIDAQHDGFELWAEARWNVV